MTCIACTENGAAFWSSRFHPHRWWSVSGLNIDPLPTDLPDQQVSSLNELGLSHTSRVELIAQLYLAIQQAGQWFNYGSQNLAARFNRSAAFMQQTVEFTDVQGQYSGTFLGIQDDGAVKILTDQGIQTFYQGQLRLKHGG